MKLKDAEEHDYELCKRLYEDDGTDIIYRDWSCEEKRKVVEDMAFSISKEDIEMINEIMAATKEKFDRILRKRYNRIYIILENKKAVGYVRVTKSRLREWKLVSFQIEPEYQFSQYVDEVIGKLMKAANMDKLVVTTISESSKRLFMEIGFKSMGIAAFYERCK